MFYSIPGRPGSYSNARGGYLDVGSAGGSAAEARNDSRAHHTARATPHQYGRSTRPRRQRRRCSAHPPGRCFGAGIDEGFPRLVERERRELGVVGGDPPLVPSLSGPVRDSSLSGHDSLGVCIRVSGTGISASAAGGLGGGRSGPSAPPMLGTPGSAARILSTSSSDVMMNWTNAQVDHSSRPKSSVSLMRPAAFGW